MRRLVALVCASALVAGCSAEAAPADPAGLSPEAATPAALPAASPSPEPSPEPSPTPTPVIGGFDAARAVGFARDLADHVGPRLAGTPADAAAQTIIADAFRAAGWVVEAQLVPLPQGGATQNLLAYQGQAPDGPFVVLGAHHDTVRGTPGANDNASGVGVLVALAEELRDEEPSVPVVLVAFAAEELQPGTREHHVGSDAHADAFGDRVVAALSVDMVANGPDTCICWFDVGPRTLADRLQAVATEAEVPGPFVIRRRGDISDHGPYARRGIPAAFLWSGRDGRYHSPSDTSEHLRVEDVERAGALALAFVRSLRPEDAQGLQPR